MTPEELVAEELAITLGDVVFDSDNVYWSVSEQYNRCMPRSMCTARGAIRFKPLAGGEAHTLAGEEDFPGALTLDAARIYWITPTGVRAVRKDGSDLKTVASVSGPSATAADDESVYWAVYAANGTIGRATKKW